MASGNNNAMLLLLGAALGVGVGLYLQSEEGKKVRKRASSKLRDIESEIEEKVKDALEKLKHAN